MSRMVIAKAVWIFVIVFMMKYVFSAKVRKQSKVRKDKKSDTLNNILKE